VTDWPEEHRLNLPDVEIVARETLPGFWVVSFYPRSVEHPAYPGFILDSRLEDIPSEGTPDSVLDWAKERWSATTTA
jgi:hypothetical protein